MPATPIIELVGLQTETRNPRSVDIDKVSTQELCRILNREDSQVPQAVGKCIPVIAEAIEALSERVRNGGRVFYIGAGTSGRLGVLDASEIPPTYSAPGGQFVALIAGGDTALRHAREGAEDSREAAEEELRNLKFDAEVDSLIGIASSGRTPYVLGGLAYVRSVGGTTAAVVCVEPSEAGKEGNADFLISAVSGPEVVTGSTRMKAGTATKLVLNMISTGIMIKLGKTYGNLMIDLKATNEKLKQRAKNILRFVGGSACTQTDEELEQILADCHGSVKHAAATIVLGVPATEAGERLRRNKGVLAKVFDEQREKGAQPDAHDDGVVLCVDAGGTSCKAVIMSKDGSTGTGSAGPCNLSNTGLDAALATIEQAIQGAVDTCETTKGRQFRSVRLSAAWIGMAGYGRPSLTKVVESALSDMLKLPLGKQLKITADIDVLPAGVADQQDTESVIVLVAGTGSIAMSYSKIDDEFQRTSRVGGWGYLLGDEGSGYGLGREAVRLALQCSDRLRLQKESGASVQDFPPLCRAVVDHFQTQHPDATAEDLLSTVVMPDHSAHQTEDASLATTKRIAGVAKVVLSMGGTDDDAQRIIDAGVASLVQLVVSLVESPGRQPSKTRLVLAGGLMQNELYKSRLLAALQKRLDSFKSVHTVTEPAVAAAKYMLKCLD